MHIKPFMCLKLVVVVVVNAVVNIVPHFWTKKLIMRKPNPAGSFCDALKFFNSLNESA